MIRAAHWLAPAICTWVRPWNSRNVEFGRAAATSRVREEGVATSRSPASSRTGTLALTFTSVDGGSSFTCSNGHRAA
jgi:hypothetical protein